MSVAYAFRCDAYLGDGRSCPGTAVIDAQRLEVALQLLDALGWLVADTAGNERHVCRRCWTRRHEHTPTEVAP